ncbi:hypothetical protein [Rhizobium sp. LjRoot254]
MRGEITVRAGRIDQNWGRRAEADGGGRTRNWNTVRRLSEMVPD